MVIKYNTSNTIPNNNNINKGYVSKNIIPVCNSKRKQYTLSIANQRYLQAIGLQLVKKPKKL